MKNENSITIEGLTSESIAFCEAQGFAKVFQAYADETNGQWIMAIGFNPNSGYVYIALEEGISICSMLGSDVEFVVTNSETGEETFFSSYEEAFKNAEEITNL